MNSSSLYEHNKELTKARIKRRCVESPCNQKFYVIVKQPESIFFLADSVIISELLKNEKVDYIPNTAMLGLCH